MSGWVARELPVVRALLIRRELAQLQPFSCFGKVDRMARESKAVAVKRIGKEVAKYIRDFINGEGGRWDWDDFESLAIADPVLERIRQDACRAGPPNPNLARLGELAAQAEAHPKS